MSDTKTDARKHRADVSRYAPRRHRLPPDEAAILPMLERLSRGESDRAPRARHPESMPPAEPMRTRRAPLAGPRLPLSAAGRIAIAVGLVVAVTAASAALLQPKARRPAATDTAKAPRVKPAPVKDQAKVQSTDMPRPVRTVAFRPQTGTAPVADTKPAPDAATAQTLPDALKSWVMYPDKQLARASAVTTGEGDKTEGARTEGAKTPESTKTSEPAKEAATKPAHARHTTKAKRTARRLRRHRRVRHRQVRTAAKPQAVQQAQAASPATQPTKKMPIQAAIDSIFGGGASGGDGGASSGGSSAPLTTGAAFQ